MQLGLPSFVRYIAGVLVGSTLIALAVPVFAQTPDPYARHIAASDPLTPEEQLRTFHLPEGFEIQLVAAEPEVRKPINLTFDTAGKLYATQSVEYPFPAKEGVKGRDTVRAYSNFAAHGKAQRVETVVDGLSIPIGVTPDGDDVIVFSIPKLYRCRDTNGDGLRDAHDVLYAEFGQRDTHGLVNSLTPWVDGWIYACHGFSNTSTVTGADNEPITMNSGNTFRLRPDGSHVEYFTHGQVNPFGLSFDPLGNMFTADCHSKPAYMLLRGGWYPSFSKPHDGLGFAPAIMEHSHGSTGISGIAYYAAAQFPREYRDTIFIGNPITNCINHDRFKVTGSTLTAIEQPDFVRCDDPWFRPVDVELGPDGALYIADFYNRIIGHYEVPLTHPLRDRERGRIWRIVYTGKHGEAKPPQSPADLAQANNATLVDLLNHANLVVRQMAVNELAGRGNEAALLVKAKIENGGTAAQRAFGLWVLARQGQLDEALVQTLSQDEDRLVRVHLVKALAERAAWTPETFELVRTKLADEDAFVQRAAADALGLHPAVENVAPLLNAWRHALAGDTQLIHTARMALRDHLLVPGMYAALAKLSQSETATDDARRLADVSLGVHTPEAAEFLLAQLQHDKQHRLPEFLHDAVRYLPADQLPDAYALALTFEEQPEATQRAVLTTCSRATTERGKQLPPEFRTWAVRLGDKLLTSQQAGSVRSGLELASEFRLVELFDALNLLAARETKFPGLREQALDVCLACSAKQSLPVLAGVLGSAEETIPLRQKAATLLGSMNTQESGAELTAHLAAAPQPVARVIAAGLARDKNTAAELLSLIASGKASARLLQDRDVLRNLEGSNSAEWRSQVEKLTASLPPADEQLRVQIEEHRQGFAQARRDSQLGQQAFKKTCANCHRVGDVGAKIAPALDGVGLRGVDRILEDVLDPSRTVDQTFRTTQIATVDGRIIQGLKLREEGMVLVLADAKGQEVRVSKDQIDQIGETPLSPMPANVSEQLKPAELYHLLEFLLEQRKKPEPSAAGE